MAVPVATVARLGARGAWLVPVPMIVWCALRAAGIASGVAEDLVTLVVMVALGGPHVVATFGRTLLEPSFWRRRRLLAAASVMLWAGVAAAAITSVAADAAIAGAPLMQYVTTAFFFWASLHVAQQHCFVGRGLAAFEPPGQPSRRLGDFVILLALFPVSLFRMSMAGEAGGADPTTLATRIVRACGATGAFADDYVFRIGRATPLLPDAVRHPATWLTVTGVFLVALVAFLLQARRTSRRTGSLQPRTRLVLAVAASGLLVPTFPSLDAAFQGINAWHAWQYFGVATLLHREAVATARVRSPRLAAFAAPAGGRRAYAATVVVTIAFVALMLCVAMLLPRGGDTHATTAAGYRPGVLLLAYHVLGFGGLLVHYLQDTIAFARQRLATAMSPAVTAD